MSAGRQLIVQKYGGSSVATTDGVRTLHGAVVESRPTRPVSLVDAPALESEAPYGG